jgi:hypothetical protein
VRRRIAILGTIALIAGIAGLVPAHAAPRHTWTPAAKGGLDCNGYSPVQKPIAHLQCVEIGGRDQHGFEDNGHYVGHDEPSLQFISNTPGSGNSAKYTMTLPVDPAHQPDGRTSGPVWTFQQRIADWFGMVMCDTQSYPEGNPHCPKDSNGNIQVPPQPDHVGAAYMELQFYPPGDPPFISNISCDTTHWCGALTIDSLQASYGFAQENDNCIEPVNFAFLQRDGVPTGPPGPDQQTAASFTPNAQTLLMNPGDNVVVSMHDTGHGLEVQARDTTTGQSGRMVAAASKGFRQIVWDPTNFTCNGAPYDFHPMYSTAAPPNSNGQPRTWATWSAHTYNIAYTPEIGHAEPATGDADDTYCPSNVLSFSMCQSTDFDFDGYPYRHVWNVARNRPTEWWVRSPLSRNAVNGRYTNPYNTIAFEADLPRIEASDFNGHCNRNTGAGCTNPPPGAGFYPWFHLTSFKGCSWVLSDNVPDQTNNFGGEVAEFGPLYFVNYGAFGRYNNYNSGPLPNPCL